MGWFKILGRRIDNGMKAQQGYRIDENFVAFFYTLFYEYVIPLAGFTIGLEIFLTGTIIETFVRRVFRG
ncbi:hypothetical protein FDZ71_10870, partial [bacterium]